MKYVMMLICVLGMTSSAKAQQYYWQTQVPSNVPTMGQIVHSAPQEPIESDPMPPEPVYRQPPVQNTSNVIVPVPNENGSSTIVQPLNNNTFMLTQGNHSRICNMINGMVICN